MGHPAHDAFVTDFLIGMARLARDGADVQGIEASIPALKRTIVSTLAGGDDPKVSIRRLASRILDASPDFLRHCGGGIRLAFGLDMGVMQRACDEILANPANVVVVNVMRGGRMSFRSRNGEALDMAKRFGGGGPPNMAGASLGAEAFSIDDAQARIEGVLGAR